MSKTFNSYSDLQKHIEKAIEYGVRDTRDYVYEVINSNIMKYYNEYSPKKYERTYRFFNSLIKLNVTKVANSYVSEVKIDEKYLRSVYPNSSNNVTGEQVANWANTYTHGGTVPGHIAFWNDSLNELGGESGINKLLEINIKKYL